MIQIRNASLLGVRKKNAMEKESGMHEIGQGKVHQIGKKNGVHHIKKIKRFECGRRIWEKNYVTGEEEMHTI
jgi:hypothetical protein